MEVLYVKQDASSEHQSCEVSGTEGCSELFLCKDQMEIMRVDASVVLIPLFRIDVLASSEGIRFRAELPGTEANDHIELGQKLRPAGLPPSQELGGRKVLQVFVISDHIDRRSGAFKIVSPRSEQLVDCKQFLVMDVVVQLRSGEGPRKIGDRPDLIVRTTEREYAGHGIIRGVGFYDHRKVRRPMSENRSRGEGVLEFVKGGATGIAEIPGGTFTGEPSQRSDNVRVVVYELTIEVSKSQEGLNVLNLLRLGQVLYGLHLDRRHSQAGG